MLCGLMFFHKYVPRPTQEAIYRSMTKPGNVSPHTIVEETVDFLKQINEFYALPHSTDHSAAPHQRPNAKNLGQTSRGGDLVFRGGRLLELVHFGTKPLGEWWSGWIYRAWDEHCCVFCSAAFSNTYTYVFFCSAATA